MLYLNLKMDLNLDVFLYKYDCLRWYGNVSGLQNIIVDDNITETEIKKIAEQKANVISGSKSCNISLLQKFSTSIKTVKSYSSLSTIPFVLSTNKIINSEIDN